MLLLRSFTEQLGMPLQTEKTETILLDIQIFWWTWPRMWVPSFLSLAKIMSDAMTDRTNIYAYVIYSLIHFNFLNY